MQSYLVWKDVSDSGAHFSAFVDGVWSPPASVPNVSLDTPPTMSVDTGMREPIVVWKPAGTLDMYSTTFHGNATNPSWTPAARIGSGDGGTNTSPTVSSGFAVWKGWGSSDYVFYSQGTVGGTWGPQTQLTASGRIDTAPTVGEYSYTCQGGG